MSTKKLLIMAISLLMLCFGGYICAQEEEILAVGGQKYEIGKERKLFNGENLNGWVRSDGKPVTAGWVVEEGVLFLKNPGSGDIFTKEHYENYILEFDWSHGEKCNSGVKYKMFKSGGGWLGLEYQIQDDANVADGKIPKLTTAGVFDVLAPSSEAKVKPLGEINKGKIVVCGDYVEHWLNDVKVLTFEIGSDDWNAKKAASKFKDATQYGPTKVGPIMLQDHNSPIRFQRVVLRPLTVVTGNELPPFYQTTFTVLQEGKPLADATVTLIPVDAVNIHWPAGGTTDNKGVLNVKTSEFAGVRAGMFKIVVVKTVTEETKTYNLVEKVYSHKNITPLTVAIMPGKNEITIDVGKAVRELIEIP